MVQLEEKNFETTDGKKIFYRMTSITPDVCGVVLIIHGMTEHGKRYAYFADKLFQQKYASVIIDLRGHGKTGEYVGQFGHFADHDGWKLIINDIRQLTELIYHNYPDLPIILFGMSMGSVAARCCLSKFGELFQAAVICGTTIGTNPLKLGVGRMVADYEICHFGAKHPSTFLAEASFGSYNKKYAPNRTDFDWLSANTANVDEYLKDPLCGFVCTSAFYRDFFSGIAFSGQKKALRSIPKDLPILLITGEEDPVNAMGKEVKKLYAKMQNAGLEKVVLKLIPNARHSILNETNRDETIAYIIDFIDDRVKKHNELN